MATRNLWKKGFIWPNPGYSPSLSTRTKNRNHGGCCLLVYILWLMLRQFSSTTQGSLPRGVTVNRGLCPTVSINYKNNYPQIGP